MTLCVSSPCPCERERFQLEINYLLFYGTFMWIFLTLGAYSKSIGSLGLALVVLTLTFTLYVWFLPFLYF